MRVRGDSKSLNFQCPFHCIVLFLKDFFLKKIKSSYLCVNHLTKKNLKIEIVINLLLSFCYDFIIFLKFLIYLKVPATNLYSSLQALMIILIYLITSTVSCHLLPPYRWVSSLYLQDPQASSSSLTFNLNEQAPPQRSIYKTKQNK